MPLEPSRRDFSNPGLRPTRDSLLRFGQWWESRHSKDTDVDNVVTSRTAKKGKDGSRDAA